MSFTGSEPWSVSQGNSCIATRLFIDAYATSQRGGCNHGEHWTLALSTHTQTHTLYFKGTDEQDSLKYLTTYILI